MLISNIYFISPIQILFHISLFNTERQNAKQVLRMITKYNPERELLPSVGWEAPVAWQAKPSTKHLKGTQLTIFIMCRGEREDNKYVAGTPVTVAI